MSTSRARFRCWPWASALLVALCAASLLLLGGSDTPAWDDANTERLHGPDSHAGDDDDGDGVSDGWLNHKHTITSGEEGGDKNPRRGCRSLLDPGVNTSRGPATSNIEVSLGVNFKAENCIDYYECKPTGWKYTRSKWKEDHRHGNSTAGSGITHHSTYTINLDGAEHRTGVNIHADVDAGLTSACGGTPPVVPPTTVPPVDPTTFTLTVKAHFSPDLMRDADGNVPSNAAPVTVTPAQSLAGCTENAAQQNAKWGAPVTWDLVNRPGGVGGATQCRYVVQLAECHRSTHRFNRGEWHGGDTDERPVIVDRDDDGAELVNAHYDGPCVVAPGEFVLRVNIVVEPPPDDLDPPPTFAVSLLKQVRPGDSAVRAGCDASLGLERFTDGRDPPTRRYLSALPVDEPAVVARLPRAYAYNPSTLCHFSLTAPSTAKSPYHTTGNPSIRFKHHEYLGSGRGVSTDPQVHHISDSYGFEGVETVTLTYEWTPPPPPPPPEPPLVCPAGSTFAGRPVGDLTYDADGDGLTGRADGDEDDCFIYCPANGGDYANQMVPSEVVQRPPGVWLAVDSEIDAAVNAYCSPPIVTSKSPPAAPSSVSTLPAPPSPLPPGKTRCVDEDKTYTVNVAAQMRDGRRVAAAVRL